MKFKVGDLVRCYSDKQWSGYNDDGIISIITEVDAAPGYFVKDVFSQEEFYFKEEEIKPLESGAYTEEEAYFLRLLLI